MSHPERPFRIAPLFVLVLIVLVSVLIVPFVAAPFYFSKTALAVFGVAFLMIFFAVRTLKSGTFSLSVSWLAVSLTVLPLAYLVASTFSSNPFLSFFGYQLETDTFGFMLLAALLALFVAGALSRKNSVFSGLLALLVASWVVFSFQLIQLFFNGPFPIPGFGSPDANLIGSWTDLSIFAGLIASLLTLAMEALPLSALHRVVVVVTLAASLFFIAAAGIVQVWILVGVTAFLGFTYAFAKRFLFKKDEAERNGQKSIGIASTAVLALSVFFVLVGGGISTGLQTTFGLNTLSVRPSLMGTLTVLDNVYGQNPLIGSGPNTFANNWLLYRPSPVLTTPFWNVEFGTGSGTIPTAFATGGVVVALGWLFLMGALAYSVTRALFMTPASNRLSYFPIAASAFAAVYLAIAHVINAPGQTITLLFFIAIGLFLASVGETRLTRSITVSLLASPRLGFAIVLASMLVIIGAMVSMYGVGRLYVSALYFGRSVMESNAGDFAAASQLLTSAIALSPQDRYYRAAGLVDLARLRGIAASGVADATAQREFQSLLASAIQNTSTAIAKNSGSFNNWFARSLVYSSLVPLGVQGAYENAKSGFAEALKRNPEGPEVDLRIADMEFARGDLEAAREAIASALRKKADYTDAILTLAQVELQANNLGKAIDSVKAAVYFEPSNPLLLYQLGILLLEDRSYQDAATAFEAALDAQPEFQNAAFFLAEAYAFLGRYPEAARLMEDLSRKNPDNRAVAEYRSALAGGENPFTAGVVPPVEPSHDGSVSSKTE